MRFRLITLAFFAPILTFSQVGVIHTAPSPQPAPALPQAAPLPPGGVPVPKPAPQPPGVVPVPKAAPQPHGTVPVPEPAPQPKGEVPVPKSAPLPPGQTPLPPAAPKPPRALKGNLHPELAGPWLWRYRLAGDSLRILAAAAAPDRAWLWLAVAGRESSGAAAISLLHFVDSEGITQAQPRYGQRNAPELRGDYSLTRMAGGPAGGIQNVVALAPLYGGRLLLFVTGPASRLLSARFDPDSGKLDGLSPVAPGGELLSGVTVSVAPGGEIAVSGIGEARRLIAWYSADGKFISQQWVALQGCGDGGDGNAVAAVADHHALTLLVRVASCGQDGGLRVLTYNAAGELRRGPVYARVSGGQIVQTGNGPVVIVRQTDGWRVLDASGGALMRTNRPLENQYLGADALIAATARAAHAGNWLSARVPTGAWLAQLDEAGLLATESVIPDTIAGDPVLANGGSRLYLVTPISTQRPDGGDQPGYDIFAFVDEK